MKRTIVLAVSTAALSLFAGTAPGTDEAPFPAAGSVSGSGLVTTTSKCSITAGQTLSVQLQNSNAIRVANCRNIKVFAVFGDAVTVTT